MVELVEGAVIQLPVQEIGADAVAVLQDLHSVISVMREGTAAQDVSVLYMRPAFQKRPSANQTALQVNLNAPAIQRPRVVVEAAVQPLEMVRSPVLLRSLIGSPVSMSQLPIVEIDPIHPAI